MTAFELIATIKTVGGGVELSADGERVRCKLPRGVGGLLEQVRQHRNEILEVLRGCEKPTANDQKTEHAACNLLDVQPNQANFGDLVNQWLHDECVLSSRCASSPRGLQRAFSAWANIPLAAGTEEAFVKHLQMLTFAQEEGMIPGLVSAADFLEAVRRDQERKSLPADDGRNSQTGEIGMSMIITNKQKQYELPDEGEHLAVLADLIDLGEVDTTYGKKDRVRFIWLVQQCDTEGKQIAVAYSYTKSLHEKASLRKVIKIMLGRDPEDSFDLETLLGMNIRLVIEHQARDERTFATIVAMLKPRKGDPVLAIPRDFVRTQNRNGITGKSTEVVPTSSKNASGGASSKEAVPAKSVHCTTTEAKVQNVHGVDITDADVQFPGGVA